MKYIFIIRQKKVKHFTEYAYVDLFINYNEIVNQ